MVLKVKFTLDLKVIQDQFKVIQGRPKVIKAMMDQLEAPLYQLEVKVILVIKVQAVVEAVEEVGVPALHISESLDYVL